MTDVGSADGGGGGGADGGATVARCEAGSRNGPTGATDGEVTPAGVHFNVRTPPAYDPTVGAPLLVMFAPSGNTGTSIESLTGLTPDAAKAGYLIAYVDTVSPNDDAATKDVAKVPNLVAARWCVDPARVYLSGSSDGASVVYTIVLEHYVSPEPSAIAPYAAGVKKETLSSVSCLTPPMPAMVMHNSGDTVFPGYGRSARDWWIACNGCGDAGTLPDGCLAYQGCADGAEIRYCEGDGGHGHWPGLNASMFEFFGEHVAHP